MPTSTIGVNIMTKNKINSRKLTGTLGVFLGCFFFFLAMKMFQK